MEFAQEESRRFENTERPDADSDVSAGDKTSTRVRARLRAGSAAAWSQERAGSALLARRIAYGGTIFYALAFATLAALHVEAFQAGRVDLGSMVQAIWSTAHGHFLESTTLAGRETTRLAGHVDPFLALLVPLWWVWPSATMLVVFQALAVSTGAFPVYWLARKHLHSDRAAAHFAFAYLLYPATQFAAFTVSSGFHAVSIAVPLILFAIWFLDEQRLIPFFIFALLAASTKEEVGAAIGCLGIWYAFRKRQWAAGAAIAALGFAISAVDFLVIIPHFSPTGVDPFAGRYAHVGGTPTGIVRTLVTDPAAVVHDVATGHKLLYVALLLGPFLGLWLLEPLLFLGAVPDLAINLLSSKSDQTAITYHWTAGIVPFTVAASILGAARLRRTPDSVSLAAVAATACVAVVSPFLVIAAGKGSLAEALPSNRTHAAKAHALQLIPDGAPVSASNQLATYLSARRYIYIYPTILAARWLVIDRNDTTYADVTGYRRATHHLLRSPEWKRVYSSRGVEVFRRIEKHLAG
jgi:uncharacterized membrane protein